MDTPIEGPVFFTCSACAARYPLHWAMAGKTVHCKACGQIVTVDPDRLAIPVETPAEAMRQLRDALSAAEGMTAAVQSLLLQHNRNREQLEHEQQDRQQAALAAKDAALETLNGRLGELEATLREKAEALDRQKAEVRELQDKNQAQERRIYDLALGLKTSEEKLLAVSYKENLLKSLCTSIEQNLKKDIDVHQSLLASLRQQLKFS